MELDYKKELKRLYPNTKEIALKNHRALYCYDVFGNEVDKVYGMVTFEELYRRLYNKVKTLLN